MMIVLLLAVGQATGSFLHFVLISSPNKTDCVREFFPANETIAFHFQVNKELTAEYYSAQYQESVVNNELFYSQL